MRKTAELKIKRRNLEEVRKAVSNIKDEKGNSLEPKIKDLVIGFQIWGIPTIMACEGHDDGWSYPWLTIPFKYLKETARILRQWNYCQGPQNPINPVIWIIDPRAEPLIRPLLGKSLRALQEDAIKFGFFLQNLTKDFDWSKD